MIIYKNFLRLIWTKKMMLIISSIIFLIISYAFLMSNSNDSTEFSEISLYLLIVDNDKSELSDQLIKYLKTKNNVTVFNSGDKNFTDEELIKLLKHKISLQEIDAGIIINKDLQKKLEDASDCIISIKDDRKQSSMYIDMQINKFLTFANVVKKHSGAFDFNKINKALSVDVEVKQIATKENIGLHESFYYFFNYLGWLLFSIVMQLVGWAIFEIKKPVISMRNRIAPIKTFRFTLENTLAQLTVVILFLVFFIFIVIQMTGVDVKNVPIFLYFVNTFIYALIVLCITFLITELFANQQIISIIGSILPMALAFISGVFLPSNMISKPVLFIAKLFPTYYFVNANLFIVNNNSISMKYCIILCGFACAYFLIGLFIAKFKQKQNAIEYQQE